jgi:hypothetical protein
MLLFGKGKTIQSRYFLMKENVFYKIIISSSSYTSFTPILFYNQAKGS